jgi:hypothetical protein
MKIRKGFVSNSSSSSFVIFVKKSDFDKIQATLSGLEKDILSFIEPKNIKAFDMDTIKISYLTGNDDSFESYTFKGDLSEGERKDLEDGASCLFEKIVKRFKSGPHLSHEESF